jgi:hypothetical protein
MAPRPLRSVLIGDVDYYESEFAFGVNQGMTLLGHCHLTVNIRWPLHVIERKLRMARPDVIWGHMLLWPPGGPPQAAGLLELMASWRKRGAIVLLHDGDARAETRFPQDISAAVDLVLCNHLADRSIWRVPRIRWPYFAFVQEEIAVSGPEFAADLVFAGRLGGGLYEGRSRLVAALQAALGERLLVYSDQGASTVYRTPELAASAGAVLGYGRPDSLGWLDVRVFQYPGAGGVLLHDDVGGFLEPRVHYVPYAHDSLDSALEALAVALEEGPRIRAAAFAFVQGHHTARHRVEEALRVVGLRVVG